MPSMQPQEETPVMEVSKKLLEELDEMGFPWAKAAQALYHSGNVSLEAAVNWLIDHEHDSDTDQMPIVAVNLDIQSPQPSDITEGMKTKMDELRVQGQNKKDEEQKKMERERNKERIRAGKLEAKRIAEENERKRNLALRQAEKEEEKRAREIILKKLQADKLERRRYLGLPIESSVVKPSEPVVTQEKQNILPRKSIKKAELMGEYLRSLRCNYKDYDTRVRRAFHTLLIYVGNVLKNPQVEKYRKIRLCNPLFQDRVGSLQGGIEFLELCGFERSEGSEFLVLPSNKVDMAVLNLATSLLRSAITNPFFGLFSRVKED